MHIGARKTLGHWNKLLTHAYWKDHIQTHQTIPTLPQTSRIQCAPFPGFRLKHELYIGADWPAIFERLSLIGPMALPPASHGCVYTLSPRVAPNNSRCLTTLINSLAHSPQDHDAPLANREWMKKDMACGWAVGIHRFCPFVFIALASCPRCNNNLRRKFQIQSVHNIIENVYFFLLVGVHKMKFN